MRRNFRVAVLSRCFYLLKLYGTVKFSRFLPFILSSEMTARRIKLTRRALWGHQLMQKIKQKSLRAVISMASLLRISSDAYTLLKCRVNRISKRIPVSIIQNLRGKNAKNVRPREVPRKNDTGKMLKQKAKGRICTLNSSRNKFYLEFK